MLRFSKEHEWLRLEGDGPAFVGITDYAQQQLGDIVFVELPTVGKQLKQGGDAAVAESVKAASEVYSPVDGKVVGVNEKLAADPALANSAPMGDGWFFTVELADKSQLEALMDEKAYAKFCAEQK
jgi:glycine cleavage system H protein